MRQLTLCVGVSGPMAFARPRADDAVPEPKAARFGCACCEDCTENEISCVTSIVTTCLSIILGVVASVVVYNRLFDDCQAQTVLVPVMFESHHCDVEGASWHGYASFNATCPVGTSVLHETLQLADVFETDGLCSTALATIVDKSDYKVTLWKAPCALKDEHLGQPFDCSSMALPWGIGSFFIAWAAVPLALACALLPVLGCLLCCLAMTKSK